MRVRPESVIAAVWLMLVALMAPSLAGGGTAIVLTQSGNHAFKVELAETADQRARGLMFREEMDADAGMLFDFKKSGPVQFWMKNTPLSLDMIFIRENGIVAKVTENTTPMSTKIVPSGEPIRYVLEVIAGTSARIGLKPGDRVLHAVIGR